MSHPWSGTVFESSSGDPDMSRWFRVTIHGETVVTTDDQDYAWEVYRASYDLSLQGE